MSTSGGARKIAIRGCAPGECASPTPHPRAKEITRTKSRYGTDAGTVADTVADTGTATDADADTRPRGDEVALRMALRN